jgi:hypothetical protein
MSAPERIYERSVRALSLVMLAIGVAILISTLIAGGGPLSFGFLLGLVFCAVGAGRLFLMARMRS